MKKLMIALMLIATSFGMMQSYRFEYTEKKISPYTSPDSFMFEYDETTGNGRFEVNGTLFFNKLVELKKISDHQIAVVDPKSHSNIVVLFCKPSDGGRQYGLGVGYDNPNFFSALFGGDSWEDPQVSYNAYSDMTASERSFVDNFKKIGNDISLGKTRLNQVLPGDLLNTVAGFFPLSTPKKDLKKNVESKGMKLYHYGSENLLTVAANKVVLSMDMEPIERFDVFYNNNRLSYIAATRQYDFYSEGTAREFADKMKEIYKEQATFNTVINSSDPNIYGYEGQFKDGSKVKILVMENIAGYLVRLERQY